MADDTQDSGYTHGPPPIPTAPAQPPVAKASRKQRSADPVPDVTAPELVPDATAPAPERPTPSRLLATPLAQQPPAHWEPPFEPPEPSVWEQPAPTPPAYASSAESAEPAAPLPGGPPTRQPWGVILGLGAVALAIIGAIVFVLAAGSLDNVDVRADDPDPASTDVFEPAAPTSPPAAPGVKDATGGIVYTGTGDALVTLDLPGGEDSMAVATITYEGDSGFFVAATDDSGSLLRTVSHSTGSYSGTVLLNAEFEDPSNRLSVQALGDWTIIVRTVSTVPTFGPEGISGSGDRVFWYEGPRGSVHLKHSGGSNFVIWSFGKKTDLVVNEIGDYSGDAEWPAGRSLIELGADGDWVVAFR